MKETTLSHIHIFLMSLSFQHNSFTHRTHIKFGEERDGRQRATIDRGGTVRERERERERERTGVYKTVNGCCAHHWCKEMEKYFTNVMDESPMFYTEVRSCMQ